MVTICATIDDVTTPQMLGHIAWLRLRKLMAERGLSPLLGHQLWTGVVPPLGTYTQREAAGLVGCCISDLSVLEAVGEDGRADLAAGRTTMAQLRLRYALRNGGGERALEAIEAQRVLRFLDELTTPGPH